MASAGWWQDNPGILFALSVKRGDITHTVDQHSTHFFCQIADGLITSFPVACADFNLDQFVMLKCRTQFLQEGVGYALVSHAEYWLHCVRFAPQMLFLSFGKLHGARL